MSIQYKTHNISKGIGNIANIANIDIAIAKIDVYLDHEPQN